MLVVPDSLDELFTKVMAKQVGRPFMYAGGPDCWRPIRTVASYWLFIAIDCGLYTSLAKQYGIWIKRVNGQGRKSIKHYFCDMANNTVETSLLNGKTPVPESDEEAILNGAKKYTRVRRNIRFYSG